MIQDIFLIYIYIIINVIIFIIGYFLGSFVQKNNNLIISSGYNFITIKDRPNRSKQTNIKSINKAISIDDTTFVVKSDTSDIEKKYNSLGETKISSEDISSSINKLKNLKK